ncbi:hypothetical protein MIDIC_340008 [Alphaproteobacteria bacterium]
MHTQLFNSYVIGSNEHESYYVFDIWYNNATSIEPQVITGDMHSVNKGNFAILHCFGAQYKSRFTSLNYRAETNMLRVKISQPILITH